MFTIDVGNSSVGVGRWIDGKVSLRHFVDPAEAAAAIDAPSWILSVSAPRLERLLDALGPEARAAARRLVGQPLPLADPRLAVSTGQDRLAAALAAVPGPVVVIDAGTALTVDLVDGQGTFLGGFIAPGPRAGLAALARAAAALPEVEGRVDPLEPGLDTPSAMAAGVWGLVVGGTDRLVGEALRCLPGARLLATGGWSEAWVSASTLDGIALDEALVHRGMVRWARREGGDGPASEALGASSTWPSGGGA